MTERMIKRPEVQFRTGLSRSTIYDGMSKGTFPRAVKLSARAVGWRESDIAAWLDSRQPSNGVAA